MCWYLFHFQNHETHVLEYIDRRLISVSIEEIEYPNLKEDFVKQGTKLGGKKNVYRAGRQKQTYINRQNNLLLLANLGYNRE